MTNKEKDIIDLGKVFKTIWAKRRIFYIVWPVVFVLSCIWIFPQPRYYTSDVKLAPEGMSKDALGGLSSVASSFGLNLGNMATADAIYPGLYPDLFESPEFIVSIMKIKVVSEDGSINTDYHTYLKDHQKKNWLTKPFKDAKNYIKDLLSSDDGSDNDNEELNPFKLSTEDYYIVEEIQDKIKCDVDKKTNVISISVKDQDRQICALLADSIKERLQSFIIDYRTKKSRNDVEYYQHLADSTRHEYELALNTYARYNEGHTNLSMQSYIEYGNKLRNDMEIKLNALNTFDAQLAAAKAKVQERTPSFTILKSATVPIRPAGPKRTIFVLGMLILSTFVTAFWLIRKEIFAYN